MLNLKALGEPFASEDLEWRTHTISFDKDHKVLAKCSCYITNRAIQQRLDDVLGPENWCNVYREITPIMTKIWDWNDSRKRFEPLDKIVTGVMCGISIRIERADGTSDWVTKWDGSENSERETVKGGLSASMKRAAVQWGIGRYLYELYGKDVVYATICDDGIYTALDPDKKVFRWNPPQLPDWALPKKDEGGK